MCTTSFAFRIAHEVHDGSFVIVVHQIIKKGIMIHYAFHGTNSEHTLSQY